MIRRHGGMFRQKRKSRGRREERWAENENEGQERRCLFPGRKRKRERGEMRDSKRKSRTNDVKVVQRRSSSLTSFSSFLLLRG